MSRIVAIGSAPIALMAAAFLYAAPASAAPVEDVIGACDRTAGCDYKIKGNGISGCSPTACFYCPADGSRQCTQTGKGGGQARTQPGGNPSGGVTPPPQTTGSTLQLNTRGKPTGGGPGGGSTLQGLTGSSSQPLQVIRPGGGPGRR
jgi:hypothetical protein